jgi:predicted chitinase
MPCADIVPYHVVILVHGYCGFEVADTGDFRRVTKIVNGGYNGIEDREKWYKMALEAL